MSDVALLAGRGDPLPVTWQAWKEHMGLREDYPAGGRMGGGWWRASCCWVSPSP